MALSSLLCVFSIPEWVLSGVLEEEWGRASEGSCGVFVLVGNILAVGGWNSRSINRLDKFNDELLKLFSRLSFVKSMHGVEIAISKASATLAEINPA